MIGRHEGISDLDLIAFSFVNLFNLASLKYESIPFEADLDLAYRRTLGRVLEEP